MEMEEALLVNEAYLSFRYLLYTGPPIVDDS
jgi:hypothetical protein